MKFETGAEKAAYYREKKKIKEKAKKLKYYTKQADKINSKRRAQSLESKSKTNVAIRKQKSRANLSMQ